MSCAHHWMISGYLGRCKLCGEEKDFKPEEDRVLHYHPKALRKDMSLTSRLVLTGGYYLQGSINGRRKVDHCFSAEWLE